MEDRKFYVYAFLRSVDSIVAPKFTPYYIGKGKGNRAFSRRRVIARPRNEEYIVFIQENLTEAEAYRLEEYCVSLYGRINNGTGILRNLINGGQGGFEHVNKINLRSKLPYSQAEKIQFSVSNAWYEYELTSPDGQTYKSISLRQFAKEHDVDQSGLSKVANGIFKQYKGWTCVKLRYLRDCDRRKKRGQMPPPLA